MVPMERARKTGPERSLNDTKRRGNDEDKKAAFSGSREENRYDDVVTIRQRVSRFGRSWGRWEAINEGSSGPRNEGAVLS
jgi:hypothetical protein